MSLISVEAAAGILGVSRRTAYRYADEKLIPVVRFKKTIRVHKEKLEQMLEEEAAASMRDAVGVPEEVCRTRETIPPTGGSLSNQQQESLLDALLELPTTRRRKH
ncbi:helix-turn-helix domain-containing protein [Pseudomonas aeruginosa]|nr:helix-turn-helix domain-containing protein [Pseudomonas aeruginosa]HDL5330847.1 helix-turn-helix domain-containing protein [Pseudomonas aeruginosa]HDP3617849.1 helix-turn-helix domain-containing protein [Pseudomonas aeruginosa]HDP3900635.1 helix-turn-helix domain-containing protein [Pseudomonas aeruginosa]